MMEQPHIDKSPNPTKTYEDIVQEMIIQNKANKKKNEVNLGDTDIDPELLAILRKQRCKYEKENM